MNRMPIKGLLAAALFLAVAMPATTSAEGAPTAKPAETGAEELTAQDTEVLAWANQLAGETSQTIEKWLASKTITEEHLFAHFYFPIPQTDPLKYTTEYDTLADRDFLGPEEKTLARSSALLYAVAADSNGYVPTHNQRYSMASTGNKAVDLLNNRTKRIFADRTGWAAAKNELPYLLQKYKQDTGEIMYDLSVPVTVRGKHWGCVRIGYRRNEK